MSVLRNLEQQIENLVEGVFGAPSLVPGAAGRDRPQAGEGDGRPPDRVRLRVYVPNQYTVWLSVEDRKRLEGTSGRSASRAVGVSCSSTRVATTTRC